MDDAIKNQISELKKKGYTNQQIVEYYSRYGKDVSSYLDSKKRIIFLITGVTAGIGILFLVGMFFFSFDFGKEMNSDDPSTWIKDVDDKKVIDIENGSLGELFTDSVGLQVRDGNVSTVFDIYGYYQGELFYDEFSDEGGVRFRISKNMTPNDGIIEFFSVFKIEDSIPVMYFYVDEDWREFFNDCNIWSGFMYSDKKEFNYTNFEDGIYIDRLELDENDFSDNYKIHMNKVFIGNMDEEKIANEINDMTFVVIE